MHLASAGTEVSFLHLMIAAFFFAALMQLARFFFAFLLEPLNLLHFLMAFLRLNVAGGGITSSFGPIAESVNAVLVVLVGRFDQHVIGLAGDRGDRQAAALAAVTATVLVAVDVLEIAEDGAGESRDYRCLRPGRAGREDHRIVTRSSPAVPDRRIAVAAVGIRVRLVLLMVASTVVPLSVAVVPADYLGVGEVVVGGQALGMDVEGESTMGVLLWTTGSGDPVGRARNGIEHHPAAGEKPGSSATWVRVPTVAPVYTYTRGIEGLGAGADPYAGVGRGRPRVPERVVGRPGIGVLGLADLFGREVVVSGGRYRQAGTDHPRACEVVIRRRWGVYELEHEAHFAQDVAAEGDRVIDACVARKLISQSLSGTANWT